MADPTKPDQGTTAIIEIDGLSEPLQNVRHFSVSDDYLQPGDTFAADVPDPHHALYKKIELFAGYRFYLRNPSIDGGTPSLRQTGIILGRKAGGSVAGDEIRLSGADIGSHLQTSAEPFFRLEQATLKDLIQKLILDNPSWGFKGVKSDNDLNRKLRQGRLGEQIRLNPSLVTAYQVIQVNPGETIIGVIQEYARRDGVMVNVSHDGYLQLSNPNYDQPTSFQVNYHRAGTAAAQTNNVIGETLLEEDGRLIYTEVTCVWDQLFVGVGQGPFTANPGRHAATYTRKTNSTQDVSVGTVGGIDGRPRPTDNPITSTTAQATPLSAGPKFPRRFVFSDSEPMTPEQGARRAVWQAERFEFDAWKYNCTLAGHSQGGRWITSDTLAAVNDSIRGVKGTLYCPSVRLDSDRSGKATTFVQLRKPGLLSNKKLVLNAVQHRGDGVFVEVQVDG